MKIKPSWEIRTSPGFGDVWKNYIKVNNLYEQKATSLKYL
jgi:hypothetical protein